MRAAVYYGNRDIRIEDRPAPRAGAGELVFRVMASGVCGSDVLEWYRLAKAPVVLGHEVSGVVEEVGAGLAGFAAGDRIVTTHHVPCDACRYCRAGQHPVCRMLRTTHFDPGGFAELIRLPPPHVARGTFAVPAHVSFEEASFVEPLACVVRGQRVAGGAAGKTVAVLGSGMSGLLHLAWAKAQGATRLLASDIHPFRLAAALRAGADVAIDARKEDVPARIQEANDGRAADLVVVATAALPALGHAMRAVDRGGTILVFALFPPGITFPFPVHELGADGIAVVSSYAGPPDDMRAALDAIAAGKIDVSSLITHRFGLGDTAEAFRLVEEAGESLKVIVEPQR
ncbi:MAG TPA: alcohol dehydrogenase catalytic domain-containing protein [Candidatus Polarisedimenticolaceae bacterium]|nr:alcohol dehydrogenase catalytic domain-containing protein [Candidatus Polarisedimenticolaceae bacterium]